ncbi:hypothetical protein D3OALGA1CA_3420 [Olavius algarvensis associated proteobacterium Delta 3]|nr:hypothetical protein D3OALGB2SA_760 [Olavius algarvensis associated proteobacterium Delta 3]CAB5134066.1 hypothetical protein D3OALGA1CA_3420 [Olavius algarvensis associated proteobacterium Delta 3]
MANWPTCSPAFTTCGPLPSARIDKGSKRRAGDSARFVYLFGFITMRSK